MEGRIKLYSALNLKLKNFAVLYKLCAAPKLLITRFSLLIFQKE